MIPSQPSKLLLLLYQSKREWLYVGVFSDEAISGTKANRPGFQKMLEEARKGKIDLIITKSISRFARNTVTLLEAVRELKELNADVYFEEQRIHSISKERNLCLPSWPAMPKKKLDRK